MRKRIILMSLVIVSLLLFSSCDKNEVGNGTGGILVSEDKKADARMEQIILAIKDKDEDALKSLFSKKALDEANDFDSGMDSLFDFIQGDIESWEIDSWASDGSIQNGKNSLIIRPDFKVVTDVEEYSIFLIDYTIDTIDPDNEGVYMLEVSKTSYSGEWESWQDRMRAGIFIVE